jgi:hypothetical protein
MSEIKTLACGDHARLSKRASTSLSKCRYVGGGRFQSFQALPNALLLCKTALSSMVLRHCSRGHRPRFCAPLVQSRSRASDGACHAAHSTPRFMFASTRTPLILNGWWQRLGHAGLARIRAEGCVPAQVVEVRACMRSFEAAAC